MSTLYSFLAGQENTGLYIIICEYLKYSKIDPKMEKMILLEICSIRHFVIVNSKLLKRHSKAKRRPQGTSLFTSAASNQRGFPKNSPWEAQVRLPEGERMRQIRR